MDLTSILKDAISEIDTDVAKMVSKRNKLQAIIDDDDVSATEVSKQTTQRSSSGAPKGLNKRQTVLWYLDKHGLSSAREISDGLGWKPSIMSAHLYHLETGRLVKRSGADPICWNRTKKKWK